MTLVLGFFFHAQRIEFIIKYKEKPSEPSANLCELSGKKLNPQIITRTNRQQLFLDRFRNF